MLNICIKSKKTSSFTARINAFRVIERLERMNILGGQNTESVNLYLPFLHWWTVPIHCFTRTESEN